MAAFAVVLKDEIRRLARKEVKALTGRTTKAVAQYRREIARLKRQLRDQERRLAAVAKRAVRSLGIGGGDDASEAEGPDGNARFSSRSVRAQRRRTGLSAADYARLVGVSGLTIYNWESGKSRPRASQFASLIALRGLGKREAQAKLAELGVKKATKKATKKTTGRRRRRTK